MTEKEKVIKGMKIIVGHAFMMFNVWGFSQKEEREIKNSYTSLVEVGLRESFFLSVAKFFDKTSTVISIKNYIKILRKSSKKEDVKVLKAINSRLKKNEPKINILMKRRNTDIAHFNKEVMFSFIEKKPIKSKRDILTGKMVIELLLLTEEILNMIEAHEKIAPDRLKTKIHMGIKQDYEQYSNRA